MVLLYKFPSARLSNYFHRAESVLLPTDSAPMRARAVAALLMLSRLFVFQINYKALSLQPEILAHSSSDTIVRIFYSSF